MLSGMAALAVRFRVIVSRLLVQLGFKEESFLLLLAVLVGVLTAAAAVGFHSLINVIRDFLYAGWAPRIGLYGAGIAGLVLIPAIGGIVVGVTSRVIFRAREGHGIVDVIESVIRSKGVIRPASAIEKIITSGVTIGTGGSAGAEGPIVQIGAAIASGIGQLFRITRPHMPILIGCGSAAGISAIFNAPIGGVFFTIEVILQEFSIRTFGPVVLASVIANVSTKAIFSWTTAERYEAIFALPPSDIMSQADLSFVHLGNFILLGLICGIVGVALTKMMYRSEEWFGRLKLPAWAMPGLGGAMLGLLAILYVVTFGWGLMGREKPIQFNDYPLPAFFSDGYGVITQLIKGNPLEPFTATVAQVPPAAEMSQLRGFYSRYEPRLLLALLAALVVIKLVATCLTLSSGGSGGVIAPSLFLGATAGGFLGLGLHELGADVQPNLYALVGMGAVLAAVVHAPFASILILLELTQDYKIILPAMLATIVALGTARLIFKDSVYTMGLRTRGVRVGTMADLTLLRRITVEQVELEPAITVRMSDPFQRLLELSEQTGAGTFVVKEDANGYAGMVTPEDVKAALMQHEFVPMLLVQDLVRSDVPLVSIADDLSTVLDEFAAHNVDHLPVSVSRAGGRVIGLVSRAALMRKYQQALGS